MKEVKNSLIFHFDHYYKSGFSTDSFGSMRHHVVWLC